MSVRELPGFVAILVGVALAVVFFVPYVARQYRKRGQLGLGNALLAFAFLIYVIALVAYTMLPLPSDMSATWCSEFAKQPQLEPFQWIEDARVHQSGTGFRSFLTNPVIQPVVLNVALFVPLGMFVRHLFHRGRLTTIAIGLGTSLLVELTQLTGVWHLFPCAYRQFNVDDLMNNTLGTAIGVLLAPVLVLVPGQATKPRTGPVRVTVWRRWLGMLCDWLSITLLGGFLAVTLDIIAELTGDPAGLSDDHSVAWVSAVVQWWVPGLLLFVLPSAALAFGGNSGGSIGQRAVLLRPAMPDGSSPSLARRLARVMTGSGMYALLGGLSALSPEWLHLGSFYPEPLLFALFPLVSLLLAWTTTGHRGLSGLIAGTVLLPGGAQQPTDGSTPGTFTGNLPRPRTLPSNTSTNARNDSGVRP